MKWAKPCDLCKGGFPEKCTICEWKAKPEPKWSLTSHVGGTEMETALIQLIGVSAYKSIKLETDEVFVKELKLVFERQDGKITGCRIYKILGLDDPELVGIRDRVDFLNRLLTFKTSTNTTYHLEADAAVNVHLEWLHMLYLRSRVAGESLHKLAKETSITHDQLKLMLTRYGAWLRRKNKVGETVLELSRVLRYYLAGYTEIQTAAKFNLPLSVATAICRKNDVFALV